MSAAHNDSPEPMVPKARSKARRCTAPGELLDDAYIGPESRGVVDPSPPTPMRATKASRVAASGEPSQTPVPIAETHAIRVPAPEFDINAWRELRARAEAHYAAQLFRIAIDNRLRHANGLKGLDDEPKRFEQILMRETVRQMRVTASKGVLEWQRSAGGIGEVMLARLLGAIGHPAIATPSHWEGTGTARVLVRDEPFLRTPRQLRQYCGHGDPARSRRVRGMSADDVAAAGSPMAKMIVHLMAEFSIIQAGRTWTAERGGHWKTTNLGVAQSSHESHSRTGDSDPSPPTPNEATSAKWITASGDARTVWPYRHEYETARDRYADRVHAEVCVRCGPAGRPALAGTPWSLKHQHAAALRKVGQVILMDLWKAAQPTGTAAAGLLHSIDATTRTPR